MPPKRKHRDGEPPAEPEEGGVSAPQSPAKAKSNKPPQSPAKEKQSKKGKTSAEKAADETEESEPDVDDSGDDDSKAAKLARFTKRQHKADVEEAQWENEKNEYAARMVAGKESDPEMDPVALMVVKKKMSIFDCVRDLHRRQLLVSINHFSESREIQKSVERLGVLVKKGFEEFRLVTAAMNNAITKLNTVEWESLGTDVADIETHITNVENLVKSL